MPKPKSTDQMLVKLEQGTPYIVAASDEYRFATGDICEALQCSRSFVDAHVKPMVHHIYVNHLYAAQVWAKSGTRAKKGGLIYRASELDDLIAASAVERRTRLVWPSTIIPDYTDDLEELLRGYQVKLDAVRADRDDPDKRCREVQDEYLRQVEADGKLLRIHDSMARAIEELLLKLAAPEWKAALTTEEAITNRGKTPWVSIGDEAPRSWRGFAGSGWQTAAGMTDWGDTAEATYRRIWHDCMMRITVAFKDGTTRLLYHCDPHPDEPRCAAERVVAAQEEMRIAPILPIHLLPDAYLETIERM